MGNHLINRKFSYSFSNISLMLVALNVLIYVITDLIYPALTYYLSLVPALVYYKHFYWQFFTYMFEHGNPYHLFSNMFALLIFGVALERVIGSKEFLLYYILVGTLSGIAAYISYYYTNTNTILLGASGAVYGVMLLFAVIFPNSKVLLFGLLPISAPVLVILYFAIEFFSQFANDGIAHSVHLFGLFFGYLYIRIRMRISPLREWGFIR